MQRARVIPILSLIENRLVNTKNFKSPKYIGDPINTIKIFNEKLVDEIIVLDIRASLNKRNPNYQLIEDMASECFMPLSYGGGINNFNQVKKVFELGVEKIVINSAQYFNLNLIKEIANVYGRQSVVVSIDFKSNFLGKTLFVSNSSSIKHKISLSEHIQKLEEIGMGELILTSIDKDGCFDGYSNEFNSLINEVNVPVTINGGLSSIEDMAKAFKNNYSAVAGTSFFVYQKNNFNSILINYPEPSIVNTLR